MRRAALLALVCFFVVPSAASAAARTPGEVAHDRARAALDRAMTLVRGQAADPHGATMILRDLRMQLHALTPAERTAARSILARPSDGRNGDWTAPKSAFKRFCAANFCVHWVKKTVDAPSLNDGNHNGRPDYIDQVVNVMTTVWNEEVGTLGYLPPKPDGGSGSHHGGNPNSKIDIFIQDIGDQGYYGYCTTDDPKFSVRNDLSAYCVLDDDFSKKQFPSGAHGVDALKVTAAHEFHHAIQFAYDYREDRWFMEATATNMEATVYPTIHDNYQYFTSSPIRSSNTNSNGPWVPIDIFQPRGGHQYGTWIFFRFLCEYFTPGVHPLATEPDCSLLRTIWETAQATPGTRNGGEYSTQAISTVIAAQAGNPSFADVFRAFGAANAYPASFYKDGANYPKAGARTFPAAITPGIGWGWSQVMFHMSNDYLRLNPETGDSTITFHVNFPASPYTPRATALVFNAAGVPTATEISLDSNGDGNSAALPFSPAAVSKVVFVLTNAGTRFTCNKGTNYSCSGNPLDDSPKIKNSAAPYDYVLTFDVG